MHFITVLIFGRSTSTVAVETSSGTSCLSDTASDSDSFCWASSSTSLALPRLARPSRQSQLLFTRPLARQQPHLNNLETHHSVTFNRCSATMMRRFWCGSCSCRVLVVLCGFVSRLGYPRSPVFVGAGVSWVLTETHQRDAPSRQDDGDIRAPTLCG